MTTNGERDKIMKNINRRIAIFVLCAACLLGVAASAQEPPVNVSKDKHPHLATAQQACRDAWVKLDEAQKANDWDMKGNAQHAKDLMVQAGEQIQAAAGAANADKNKSPNGPTGQPPALNVSKEKHPHLAAAQEAVRQAWEKLVEAQKANDWDMNGHAQKAKEMIAQASAAIHQAALAANQDGKKNK
jgi:hypothetical protein